MSRLLRLFLIAFVPALAVLPTALLAQPRVIEYNSDRWVEVSGEGSVSAAPDFARVTLGVTTTAKDAREAMAANAKSANALVQLIKSEGVAPADIQTSGLSISPIFAQQSAAAQANAPTITGYSVRDNVTVIVREKFPASARCSIKRSRPATTRSTELASARTTPARSSTRLVPSPSPTRGARPRSTPPPGARGSAA